MIYEDIYPNNDYRNYLSHYGVDHLHSKTGRGSGRYAYGSRDNKSIFVSGSSKTQDETSKYYRKELPKTVRDKLDEYISEKAHINVGDAPGVDRQVQDYLNKREYQDVTVYGPGKEVRYTANKNWKTKPVDDPDHEPGSKEWLAKKDIEMEKDSDGGLAIILDSGAKATRKNVERLLKSKKPVDVYELNEASSDLDKWLSKKEIKKLKINDKPDSIVKDMAKGAVSGVSNKLVEAGVKTALGHPAASVDLVEGAAVGAVKGGIENIKKKGGKKK